MLPPEAQVASGQVRLDGTDLLTLDQHTLNRVRGPKISMIFQEPMSALNPVMRVGQQISEGPRNLEVRRGEALALAGELGSGKSTLALALAGLQPVDRGQIQLEGRVLPSHRSRDDRRRIQMVFQDPYSSLNPRLTVGSMLGELLRVHHPDRAVVPRPAPPLHPGPAGRDPTSVQQHC